METQKGLLTKLALFTGVAITLTVLGKKHIASHNEDRHMQENYSSVDNDENEFVDKTRRPGFPSNNPNLNYEGGTRESKYVGAGMAYSSRTKGDRLSLWNIFWLRKGE